MIPLSRRRVELRQNQTDQREIHLAHRMILVEKVRNEIVQLPPIFWWRVAGVGVTYPVDELVPLSIVGKM